jgi:hypothetical protein
VSSATLVPQTLAAQPGGVTLQVVKRRTPAAETNRRTWVLSPAVFLVAAGATFLGFYIRTGSVTASTPRMSPLFDPRGASLQMRVETQASGLRLSWNRYSPAVQAAKSGVLEIDEGGQHRQITLDRNQIVNGSIFYRPASDDVSFRLDLRDAQGSDVAQILRVLDAAPKKPAAEPVIAANMSTPEPVVLKHKTEMSASATAVLRGGNSSRLENSAGEHAAPAASTPVANGATAQVTTADLPPSSETASPRSPVAQEQTPATNPAPSQELQSPATQPAVKTLADTPQPTVQTSPSGLAAPKETPIAGYVPPRPLKWVKLEERASGGLNAGVPLDIKVKVKIDETGHVTAAHALIDGGRRDKKLMAAAAAAVRQWVFEPAKANGTNVASEETIVIHVGPEVQ